MSKLFSVIKKRFKLKDINSMHLRGFTIIELIVVVAILSILSGILIAVINPGRQQARARDAVRRSDLVKISSALEQYYADNNKYPPSNDGARISFSNIVNDINPYMNDTVPTDPSGGWYCYTASGSRPLQKYVLCATLETAQSDEGVSRPSGCTSPTYCVANPF